MMLDMEDSLKELWALHELFRRFGFDASEIFFVTHVVGASNGRETVGMAISRPPHLFTVSLDHCKDPQAIRDVWETFAESVNTFPSSKLQQMWTTAELAPRNILGLAQALAAKGLPPPKAESLWKPFIGVTS